MASTMELTGDDGPWVFGARSEYWARYDKIADAHDVHMVGRLNSDLDVLLIFAGLFSAVNTAFIVVTLANLSPNPSGKTNTLLRLLVIRADNSTLTANDLSPPFQASVVAIRQNCTFFASLCSSLLAAIGAVLAKQWLGSYERTGQTGSLEKQCLRRTEKFLGAEALPVALVVSTFSIAGILVYGFTVIAAAVDVRCPFQTSVSSHLRRIWISAAGLTRQAFAKAGCLRLRSHTSAQQIASPTVSAWTSSMTSTPVEQPRPHIAYLTSLFRKSLRGIDDLLWSVPPTAPGRVHQGHPRAEIDTAVLQQEMLYARSIAWMLEVGTEESDLQSAADNIPALSRREAVQLIARPPYLQALIVKLRKAMTAFQINATAESEVRAVTFARAVGHVFAADPTACHQTIWRTLKDFHIDPQDNHEVYTLIFAIRRLCHHLRRGDNHFGRTVSFGLNTRYFVWQPRSATDQRIARGTTALVLSTLLTLSGTVQYCNNVQLETDAFFSLLALSIRQQIEAKLGDYQSWDYTVNDVWVARTGQALRSEIMKTLRAITRYIAAKGSDRSLIQAQTTLLCRLRALGSSQAESGIWCTAEVIPSEAPLDVLISWATPEGREDGNIFINSLNQVRHRFSSTNLDNQYTEDLRDYALQLLLTLGREFWSVSRERAATIAYAIIVLQIRDTGKHQDTAELLSLFGFLGQAMPIAIAQHVITHPAVAPILINAMNLHQTDTPLEVLKLLNYVGISVTAECGSMEACVSPPVIRKELVVTVIRTIAIQVEGVTETAIDYIHTLDWLAKSVGRDPSLAPVFREAGIRSLFRYEVQKSTQVEGNSGEAASRGQTDACGDLADAEIGDTWNTRQYTMLFIGILYLGTRSPNRTNPLSRSECEDLAQYIRIFMRRLRKVDWAFNVLQLLFAHTCLIVERAFIHDIKGAFAAKLDDACESLVLEVLQHGCEDHLSPWWHRVKKAYTDARDLRPRSRTARDDWSLWLEEGAKDLQINLELSETIGQERQD
ncbi:hypothetical protein FRB94_006532 [Tulasnella sp. JGI-2019a]|nr:hypothetical protein FRB94_006532 [Tulasnella sp. JGI-2019a]